MCKGCRCRSNSAVKPTSHSQCLSGDARGGDAAVGGGDDCCCCGDDVAWGLEVLRRPGAASPEIPPARAAPEPGRGGEDLVAEIDTMEWSLEGTQPRWRRPWFLVNPGGPSRRTYDRAFRMALPC